MSLDEDVTLERPRETPFADAAPSAWTVIGGSPHLARMNNYPFAAQRDGVIYVYSGGDGGNSVVSSDDGGVTWNPPQTGDWPVRRALSGALHGGRFYIVGGFSPGRGFSDTLVSDDCLHWTQVGEDPPPWGVRWAHTLLSAGDKLLMIGGVSGPDYSDEVWALGTDAVWRRISHGQFTPRAWAAGARLGADLLVIGGWNDTDGAFAETLVSSDGGATWTSHRAPFAARHSAAAVTIGDTVYLVGGCTGRPGTTFYGDVWATKDGISWARVDYSFSPLGRTFAALPLAGKVAVLGSSTDVIGLEPSPLGWSVLGQCGFPTPWPTAFNVEFRGLTLNFGRVDYRIVSSPDGVAWSQVQNDLPKLFVVGALHEGGLWVCGGEPNTVGYANDVYRSDDGEHWRQVTPAAEWSARLGHMMASFNGRLWVMGGMQGRVRFGDVWSWSPLDQGPWRQESPQAFTPRTEATAVVFLDQLWVVGGLAASGLATTYARMGLDGRWTEAQAPWSPGRGKIAAVVGGALYVAGGGDGLDCWATADGEHWTRIDDLPTPHVAPAGYTVKDVALLTFGAGDPQAPTTYRCIPPQVLPPQPA